MSVTISVSSTSPASAQESLQLLAVELAATILRDGQDGEWSEARRLVRSLTAVEKNLILAAVLCHEAHHVIRRDTLAAEREAQRPPEETLFRGKYRHGSYNQRTGAALRGCECEECVFARQRYENDQEMESESLVDLFQFVGDTVEKFKEDLYIEWTAELLDSQFALRDGTQVTWGAATLDEHRERVDMFSANALANLEGAARHSKAIDDIEAAGVKCLYEIAA